MTDLPVAPYVRNLKYFKRFKQLQNIVKWLKKLSYRGMLCLEVSVKKKNQKQKLFFHMYK